MCEGEDRQRQTIHWIRCSCAVLCIEYHIAVVMVGVNMRTRIRTRACVLSRWYDPVTAVDYGLPPRVSFHYSHQVGVSWAVDFAGANVNDNVCVTCTNGFD